MQISRTREELKSTICENCRHFYDLGWVSGTGGGMSIKTPESTVLIAPSGVEKEKLQPEDIFEISMTGEIIERSQNPKHKLSACTPLFLAAYSQKQAGAVMHSHSLNAFLASKIAHKKFHCKSVGCIALKNSLNKTGNTAVAEIIVTEMEMMKGIKGFGYHDTMRIPVIENTAEECDLTDSLNKAIEAYPDTYAVVVMNHGIYVWGDNHTQTKTHAECYDYILQAYVKIFELNLEE